MPSGSSCVACRLDAAAAVANQRAAPIAMDPALEETQSRAYLAAVVELAAVEEAAGWTTDQHQDHRHLLPQAQLTWTVDLRLA